MNRKNRIYILIAWFFFISINTVTSKDIRHYDIIVYGATSGGLAAAIQSARMGKSVLLVEPSKRIGGLTTGGLGQTDIGNKSAIGGISREFYQHIKKYYEARGTHTGSNDDGMWKFEPSAALAVFKDMISREKIDLIYSARLKRRNAVKMQNGKILRIALENGAVYQGSVFIDATYEGDLMAAAGVSYVVGREENAQYGENWNGVYLAAYREQSGYHQFPDNIDPYKIPGQPRSGLLWGIDKGVLRSRGSGDKKVQAYNFRICLTDSAENMIPITKPDDYDAAKYELLARLFVAQPQLKNINEYFIWSRMPNRKTDINNRGAFSTDMIGANYNWPEASFRERARIFQEHLSYTRGLLYFYRSDPRVPESLRKFISSWGYPKDEYLEDGHFTPQLYVREGRRMVGEYVMSELNCIGKDTVKDAIGLAAYAMDSHNCQRIVVNGMVKNEGNVEVGAFPPYPISYRSILPKRAECTNLLVPVALSATHIAFGSIRMEPVFMVLGQSAAIAANLAIDNGQKVQEVPYEKLKELLLQYNQRTVHVSKK